MKKILIILLLIVGCSTEPEIQQDYYTTCVIAEYAYPSGNTYTCYSNSFPTQEECDAEEARLKENGGTYGGYFSKYADCSEQCEYFEESNAELSGDFLGCTFGN